MGSSSVLLFLLPVLALAQYQQQPVRVAPGVPPQHYQHQAPGVHPGGVPQQQPHHVQQQQFQQQQFQQQQVPVQHVPGVPPPQHQQQQHHQVPVQQQHVPVQHQQQQVQGQVPIGSHPGHGHDHGKLLDASNVLNERSHIQEHLDLPIDTSQMTEQELQFHYFKMHDADNNNKLDGTELVKSLLHWHDGNNHNPNSGHPIPEPKIFTDQELTSMIDPILKNDDLNQDGTIDYSEFSRAQQAAAVRAQASGGHQ